MAGIHRTLLNRSRIIGKNLMQRAALKRRLTARIKRSYFVRFHMFLILSATVISAVICSKVLSLLGISSMPVRYGIAIIFSYFLFFLFVKLWLLYIGIGRLFAAKKNKGGSLAGGDMMPSFGGSGSGSGASRFSGFRGGSSGGGGSSESFAEGNPSVAVPVGVGGGNPVVAEGGHGNAGSILDGLSGVGDEGFLKVLAIVLLAALVFSVVIVGGYLIWCAPVILSDAAFHVLLVAGLSRKVRRVRESNWEMSILKATWWGFLLILVAAVVFGIVAKLYNPAAVTVSDLFTNAK
jgi:hypothetical protein